MKYPGGKNGSGVYQRLISMMPPHDVYIELFLGSGAVMRRKKPADRISFAYELNAKTIDAFAAAFCDGLRFRDRTKDVPPGVFRFDDDRGRPVLDLYPTSAIDALRDRYSASSAFWFVDNDPSRTLIYADPPYLLETRSSKSRIYQFEMFERREHIEFLDLAAAVPCKVMISGYANPLYNRKLKHWRTERIPTVNRAGDKVIETVWLNFPEPFELHDYEHVGTDFRDRWRIEKKARNWERNLFKMPAQERYAILGRLNERRAEFEKAERLAMSDAADSVARNAGRRDRQNRKSAVTPEPALAAAKEQDLFL